MTEQSSYLNNCDIYISIMSKIWENMVNEVKYDYKWVNMAKKGFSQDYLINTFIEIW